MRLCLSVPSQSEDTLIEVKVSQRRHWQCKVKEILYELVSRSCILLLQFSDLDFSVCLLLRCRLRSLRCFGLDLDSSDLVQPRDDGCGDTHCPESGGVVVDSGETVLGKYLDLGRVELNNA